MANHRKSASPATSSWTFLTNHAHVLLCIAENCEVLLRDVATRVGITERAVQRIVAELEEAGYLERERLGRCNRYHVRAELPLRHPVEAHRTVSSLIALGQAEVSARKPRSSPRSASVLGSARVPR